MWLVICVSVLHVHASHVKHDPASHAQQQDSYSLLQIKEEEEESTDAPDPPPTPEGLEDFDLTDDEVTEFVLKFQTFLDVRLDKLRRLEKERDDVDAAWTNPNGITIASADWVPQWMQDANTKLGLKWNAGPNVQNVLKENLLTTHNKGTTDLTKDVELFTYMNKKPKSNKQWKQKQVVFKANNAPNLALMFQRIDFNDGKGAQSLYDRRSIPNDQNIFWDNHGRGKLISDENNAQQVLKYRRDAQVELIRTLRVQARMDKVIDEIAELEDQQRRYSRIMYLTRYGDHLDNAAKIAGSAIDEVTGMTVDLREFIDRQTELNAEVQKRITELQSDLGIMKAELAEWLLVGTQITHEMTYTSLSPQGSSSGIIEAKHEMSAEAFLEKQNVEKEQIEKQWNFAIDVCLPLAKRINAEEGPGYIQTDVQKHFVGAWLKTFGDQIDDFNHKHVYGIFDKSKTHFENVVDDFWYEQEQREEAREQQFQQWVDVSLEIVRGPADPNGQWPKLPEYPNPDL